MSWSRHEIAARAARDIPDGAYVNLGIGMPTLVADHVPEGKQFILHTENGMLGMGRAATEDEIDPDLINAGKIHVTEEPGAAYFDHAESFGMIRGGHLSYCVIGAYQVSQDGDLANWRTTSPTVIPGVGGAMDLAVGARHVFVAMDLFTRSGECKLVKTCTYPLTATRCVERVYSDHGVFEPSPDGFRVVELAEGVEIDDLRQRSGLDLIDTVPGATGKGTS
ncbi:3-oxoacid CoA-transferase subunit B [Amycolatopsis thermoflava]|uniref:3-oxoacid CoA-transferase subunit B n=1 Tax=Amycolatopsis thermoflava TaxID=84480 RepID=UPI00040FA92E|nr:3-oxoacid CoA-transferase subunit B [Amycolatopsis thermoflava]